MVPADQAAEQQFVRQGRSDSIDRAAHRREIQPRRDSAGRHLRPRGHRQGRVRRRDYPRVLLAERVGKGANRHSSLSLRTLLRPESNESNESNESSKVSQTSQTNQTNQTNQTDGSHADESNKNPTNRQSSGAQTNASSGKSAASLVDRLDGDWKCGAVGESELPKASVQRAELREAGYLLEVPTRSPGKLSLFVQQTLHQPSFCLTP